MYRATQQGGKNRRGYFYPKDDRQYCHQPVIPYMRCLPNKSQATPTAACICKTSSQSIRSRWYTYMFARFTPHTHTRSSHRSWYLTRSHVLITSRGVHTCSRHHLRFLPVGYPATDCGVCVFGANLTSHDVSFPREGACFRNLSTYCCTSCEANLRKTPYCSCWTEVLHLRRGCPSDACIDPD